MINRRNEMRTEVKEKVRGGEGSVQFTYLVETATEKHATLLAEVSVPPGASIGPHTHDLDVEYYFIISGSGIVNDNGTDTEVKTGDAVITKDGASHSISNTGNVPLVFHAVIVKN